MLRNHRKGLKLMLQLDEGEDIAPQIVTRVERMETYLANKGGRREVNWDWLAVMISDIESPKITKLPEGAETIPGG